MTQLHYEIFPSTQTGILRTREPSLVQAQTELNFSFENAFTAATAVFENVDGKTLYRRLDQTTQNTCAIPASFLSGELKICLAAMDGTKTPSKIKCETLYTKSTPQGILLYPAEKDLPKQMITLHAQVQVLSDMLETLAQKYKKLETNVETMLNGYDFD